jgi:Protein of unknown function (DUF1592)/Protein of unknown function (DUF1588)
MLKSKFFLMLVFLSVSYSCRGVSVSPKSVKRSQTSEGKASGQSVNQETPVYGLKDSTVLPECNVGEVESKGTVEKNSEIGVSVWRLSSLQLANTYKTFNVQVNFADYPGDSSSGRFDTHPNGFVPKQAHVTFFEQQAEKHAQAVLNWLVANKSKCAKTDLSGLKDDSCQKTFVETTLTHILRKRVPQTEINSKLQTLLSLRKSAGDNEGTKDFITHLLMLPDFLYRIKPNPKNNSEQELNLEKSYAIANHISYSLTDFPPDDILIGLAEKNELLKEKVRQEQALRLIKTENGKEKFISFAKQWLKIPKKEELYPQKDSKIFPAFTNDVYGQMVKETERYLFELGLEQKSSLKDIFSSTSSKVSDSLNNFYQNNLNAGDKISQKDTNFENIGRFGVLTQGAVVAALSQSSKTSTIHRGALMRSHFLCHALPGPPADALAQNAKLPENVVLNTEKEKYNYFVQNARQDCSSCHKTFVPYGLALENYGPDGRWRELENKVAIDSSGSITAPSKEKIEFQNGKDLLNRISQWDALAHCTFMHAHEFHWGGSRNNTEACVVNSSGVAFNTNSSLLDVYLSPVVNKYFFEF